MKDTLWELFRETGDPMGYLLCKAEEQARREAPGEKQEKKSQAPAAGPPTASN